MRFPESFYYRDLKTARGYHDSIYSYQELSFGKKLPDLGQIRKKQLLLTDWRLIFLPEEKDDFEYYLKKVQLLIYHGFTVWVPAKDEFIKLKSSDDLRIHLTSFKPSILPMQEIFPRGMLYLDYFVMGQIFPELNVQGKDSTSINTPLNEKFLKLSDLNKLRKSSKEHYERIVDELMQQPPSLLNVVLDITNANIVSEELAPLFNSDAIQGLYLFHGWLPTIFESIKLRALNGSFLKMNDLKMVLMKSQELEIFILDSRCHYKNLFEDVRLPKLKQLILLNCNFYLREFRSFLKRAENLEELILVGCRVNLAGLFKKLKFPKLKKIDFSNSIFNIKELNSFLQRNINIEEIYLTTGDVNLDRLFKNVSKANLRKIELQKTLQNEQHILALKKKYLPDIKFDSSANYYSTENVHLNSTPLKSYMQIAGLPYYVNGLCLGLCLAAAEAFANGSKSYAEFRDYIKEIFALDLKNVTSLKISVEMLAFLQKIVLYQTPENFPEYFKFKERPYLQQFNLRLSASIAQSQLTERRGGLNYHCFSSIYDSKDLEKYLLSYAKWLDTDKDMRCPLILDSDLHAIMLAYDSHAQKWFFEDYAEQSTFDRGEIVELGKAIKAAHLRYNRNLIVFKEVQLIHSTILCIKNRSSFNKSNSKKLIFCQAWFDSKEYKSIHKPNKKNEISLEYERRKLLKQI